MANRAQEKLTKDDLPNLTNILTPVASKCSELGLQLGVKHWAIRNIEKDHRNDCEAQLQKIVEERLNQEQPLTWRDLVEALRSPSVRAYELAQQIESQYMMSQPSQSERNNAQQNIAFPLSIQPEHALQTTHTQSSTAVTQTHQISEQSTMSNTLPASLPPPPVVPPPSHPSLVPQPQQLASVVGPAPQLPQSSQVNQTYQITQPSSQVGSSQLPQIHYPVMLQPQPQQYPPPRPLRQYPPPRPLQQYPPPRPLQQYPPPRPLQQYPPPRPLQQYPPPRPLQQYPPPHPLQQYQPPHPLQQYPPPRPLQQYPPPRPLQQYQPPHPLQQYPPPHPLHQYPPPRPLQQYPPPRPLQQYPPPRPLQQYQPPHPLQQYPPPHPLHQYPPPHPLQQYPPPRPLHQYLAQHLPYFPPPIHQPQCAPPTQSVASVHPTPETSPPPSKRPREQSPVRPHPQPHPQPSQGELECSPLVKQYIDYVKTVYSRVKRATHVVKWPITLSETYTNLVCIDRRMTTEQRKEYDEVTKAMVEHGDVDVVYGKKWPINFDKIASGVCGSGCVVLVEGAPGVGKSTFAWEYCRRWARGEIGQHYQLVLLLRLRDPRMSRARTLGDLIPNPSADVHRAVVRHLECSHGLNTLIILEGFDELPDACRSHQSVFLRLISGELLPSATVMVTSRPWATETLVKNYSHCIFQHIEILGFTRKQIVSHIRSVLPGDEAKNLEAYMSIHPQIRGCMYIPLNTVIVLSVFKERQASMPTTLTELYTAVVQTLLVRYLQYLYQDRPDLEKSSKSSIHEDLFKDLSVPHTVKRNFLQLCQLAYKGIKGRTDRPQVQQSNVIIGSDPVQLIFEESDLPEDFDNLGFMDSVTELYATRGAVSSYNFLHLTFQEFFAAIHISTMSPAEQVEHFQQHGDGKLKVVLRFLAGISKMKCLMSETVRDTFVTSSERDKCNLESDAVVGVDLVNWMFEAQSDRVIASLIKEKLIEFQSDGVMLPMDYYSLGYCVVHSHCDWDLYFQYNEQQEDSDMLVAGASLRPDTSGRVVGLHTSDTDFLATMCVELMDILHLHVLTVFSSTLLDHIPWSDLSSLRVLRLRIDDDDAIMGLDTTLSALSLESLYITGIDDEFEQLHHDDCVALARAASTLKELTVHDIKIQENGVEVITKALVSNQSLDRLELNCDCFFTDTAADCLAQFITSSTTLQYLELRLCWFSVRGLRVLAQATHNPTVHTKKVECSELDVLLNDGGDINELDELFRVYPNMRDIVEGVKVSHNSTLVGEHVSLTEYSKTEIDTILTAYPDCKESIQSICPNPTSPVSSSPIHSPSPDF